jgi:hypothetical protein
MAGSGFVRRVPKAALSAGRAKVHAEIISTIADAFDLHRPADR